MSVAMGFTVTFFRSFGAGMKSEQKSTLADLANLASRPHTHQPRRTYPGSSSQLIR